MKHKLIFCSILLLITQLFIYCNDNSTLNILDGDFQEELSFKSVVVTDINTIKIEFTSNIDYAPAIKISNYKLIDNEKKELILSSVDFDNEKKNTVYLKTENYLNVSPKYTVTVYNLTGESANPIPKEGISYTFDKIDMIYTKPCVGVKSVAPTSITNLRIEFNTDVEEKSATSIENYKIIDKDLKNVNISAVVFSKDSKSVIYLSTDDLSKSESYTLKLFNINAIDTTIDSIPSTGKDYPFSGLEINDNVYVDINPPVYISPEDEYVCIGGTLLLEWTTVIGATEYEIEVSSNSDFSTLILNSPIKVKAPYNFQQFKDLDPGTYYWRVRADVTKEGEYSTVAGEYRYFIVYDEYLYVYCPENKQCSNLGKNGSKDYPYETISKALELAKIGSFKEIKVAARGGTDSYTDILDLADGVNLIGGYNTDFTIQNSTTYPTYVKAPVLPTEITGIVQANSHQKPITIDGFELEKLGTSDTLIGVFFQNMDNTITLKNCNITVPSSANSNAYGMYNYNTPDIVVENCSFTVGNGEFTYGIYNYNATIDIRNSTMTAGVPLNEYGQSIGIYCYSTKGIIHNNNITGGPSPNPGNHSDSIGINSEESILTITNNNIQAGRTSCTAEWADSFVVKINNSSVKLYNNSLFMLFASSGQYGICASGTGDLDIQENIINSDNAGNYSGRGASIISTDIPETTIKRNVLQHYNICNGGNYAYQGISLGNNAINSVIEENIIRSNFEKTGTYGIKLYSEGHTIKNNIIFSYLSATYSDPSYGIAEMDADSDPSIIENNLVFNFEDGLYYDDDTSLIYNEICSGNFGRSSCSQTLGTPSTATGNITAASIGDVFDTGFSDFNTTTWVIKPNGPADLDNSGAWSDGDIGCPIPTVGPQ